MTSKTSLFNKGIYKSTIRRFLWGSILYFIMLFICTGMMLFLNEDPSSVYQYGSLRTHPTLLSSEYMILPMLMSMVVPTVAGLLIFRFVHSKKTSVFVHSLPVKREKNYISSVFAALTLMCAPVVLNALILMIMSLTTFSLHFSVGDCAVWMLLNLFALFIMFSAVCFVAMLTGNSFAMIGLNILFHTIATILAATFTLVCDTFLFGFAGGAELLDKVFENSFLMKVPTIMMGWTYTDVKTPYIYELLIFSAIAIVLYVVSGILYKKRRLETAEDVAGFNCLNGIFKYLVTFVAAMSAFSITAYSIHESPVSVWVIVFIVSTVFYFGIEMLLKKTFRVWKSYKGYIAFTLVFAAMMCVFALTNFFGFETYIPEKEDVKSVAVYEYYDYRESPFVSNEEIIEKTISEHGKLISEIQTLPKKEYEASINVEYILKNNKRVNRVYYVDQDQLHDMMNNLYKNEEYKKNQEEIFAPMKEVVEVTVNGEYQVEGKAKISELIDCIKTDVKELDYNEMYSGSRRFFVQINYLPAYENEDEKYIQQVAGKPGLRYENIEMNSNYKHTIKWLKDNGYWDKIALENAGVMYIVREWKDLPFVDNEGNIFPGEEIPGKDSFIKIENKEDREKFTDFCNNARREYVRAKDRFTVYIISNEIAKDLLPLTTISKEELRTLFPEKNLDKLN